MKKNMMMLLLFMAIAAAAYSQNKDTVAGASAVTITASKWEQKQNEVPNKITKVSKEDILLGNPQTSADLLAQSGSVFVQKSQLGGGSPMIRGFATNRVLLVVDGVRMNNAIYRSGNLQNVISIDALSTETAEVVFGPGSLVYGSDAIGGVMDFHSLEAKLNTGKKGIYTKGSGLVRYSSANAEKTAHADVSIGSRKFSYMGSVTYSQFDDLIMGINGGQQGFLRPQFVQRFGNRDSIVNNPNPRKQVFSGYNQWNTVQKLRFKPSEGLDLQYTFYYGGTGVTPRYDRLIEKRNGALRFAEWNYGPMLWRMHTLSASLLKKNALYDNARLVIGYQNYEESRIDRQRNNANRRSQLEQVVMWTGNFDANKQMGKGELFYGLEVVTNDVGSTANSLNINTGAVTKVATRYPDGSSWNSFGAYANYRLNFHPKFTANAGLRYNYAVVKATFNSQFFPFPFQDANINDGAVTGNLGLVYRPAPTWQLNANISTGFRVPNIDDIGKLFESTPGNLTVPNPNLRSEYAWNAEIGMVKQLPGKLRLELNAFYTLLNNAIVRRPSTFNGQDSIVYDGVKSRVESLQNVGKATVWGLQAVVEAWLNRQVSLYTMANYITGQETDDVKNEQVPLRHAPPFYGSTGIRYRNGRLLAEANAQYNSEVSYENLAPSERAKTAIYAVDAQGRPYSPGWYTINTKVNYAIKNVLLGLGWENITNQRYRPYSSGIVAAGSNFIVSLRYGW
jgi:hemoglobin/transferrin/lactoferrin receptor protein